MAKKNTKKSRATCPICGGASHLAGAVRAASGHRVRVSKCNACGVKF